MSIEVAIKQILVQRKSLFPASLRFSKSPYVVIYLNRLWCTYKSSLSVQRGGAGLGLLNCFWNKDDLADDVDGGNNCKGFFCGSPSVRTNNPLVLGVHFVRQTSYFTASTSPSGMSMGWA